MNRHAIALLSTLPLLCVACGSRPQPAQVEQPAVDPASARLLADDADGANWPAYGRTYGEQHFSPLDQINAGTIGKLGLAWSLDLPAGNTVTQPLAVNGTLYFTVGNSIIHAVDALTGKPLWTFDPKANEAAGPRMRTSWGSRGIAYWNGKIYTGTVDGRLIAVDARTGKEIWSRQTLQDGDLRYITGAPRVFEGKVIIGHGGADSSDVRGYVTTYNAETGDELWRFFLVPGDPNAPPDGAASDPVMAKAAATWSGQWWKYGGGGTAWNAFTYDRDTDTILIGTGNGAPWNHKVRSEGKGDNLFLCSILALDAKTGRYKWHYQINPGETWDYNASMDMHLADMKVGDAMRKVVVTAPKNGFLYVIDRTDGTLLSAEKIARVTWASHIDLKSGRPVETPGARFPDGKAFELWPSMSGAHNNLPSAFSPKTGLVYIPLGESGAMVDDKGVRRTGWTRAPGGAYDFAVNVDFRLPDGAPAPSSALVAWDPVKGRQVWRAPTPLYWNGGLLVTGGNLVFQGQVDGKFNAYDAADGKKLWTFATHSAALAPPISYAVNGKQYITVLTGMGLSAGMVAAALPARHNYRTQERRVLTFAIGGTARLPAKVEQRFVAFDDPDYRPEPAAAARGAATFARCFVCHGVGADGGGGVAPDLRTSATALSPEAFASIVHDGALVAQGMPQFGELSDAEMDDLRHYIRQQAAALRGAKAAR